MVDLSNDVEDLLQVNVARRDVEAGPGCLEKVHGEVMVVSHGGVSEHAHGERSMERLRKCG